MVKDCYEFRVDNLGKAGVLKINSTETTAGKPKNSPKKRPVSSPSFEWSITSVRSLLHIPAGGIFVEIFKMIA